MRWPTNGIGVRTWFCDSCKFRWEKATRLFLRVEEILMNARLSSLPCLPVEWLGMSAEAIVHGWCTSADWEDHVWCKSSFYLTDLSLFTRISPQAISQICYYSVSQVHRVQNICTPELHRTTRTSPYIGWCNQSAFLIIHTSKHHWFRPVSLYQTLRCIPFYQIRFVEGNVSDIESCIAQSLFLHANAHTSRSRMIMIECPSTSSTCLLFRF